MVVSTPRTERIRPRQGRLNGRILFLVNDTSFFLSHRLPIAQAAQAAGMAVHVATPADIAVARLRDEGFCHHAVPIHRWGASPVRELATFSAIRRVLREVHPDILHNVTIKPLLYGSFAARNLNIAVVNAVPGLGTLFVREGGLAALRRAAVKRLYRGLFRRPNVRVIVQNRDDLAVFVDGKIIDQSQAILIRGSGVDLEQFSPTPLPGGTPVVLLASRMLWDKGVGEFVVAAEKLRETGVPARFVLVGPAEEGNPATVSEARLEEWDGRGIIEWWGRRDDMAAVLERAHIVCLPSYREGLPKALLEAAACGRPLIAADVPGCREVVRHGTNGLLVPPKDSVAIVNAVAELLADRRRAEAMGKRSREIAEKEFGVNAVVHQTLRLYEQLLESNRSRVV